MRRRVWIFSATTLIALTSAVLAQSESFPAAPDLRFVLRNRDGRVSCEQDTRSRPERDERIGQRVALHQINHLTESAGEFGVEGVEAGLTIILRGTAQLEGYPEAKSAFVHAADTWERLITNRLTVYVDVDFGPTAFGEPFPDADTLGVTSQRPDVEYYADVRSALTSIYRSSTEIQSLPHGSLPTDIGPVTFVVAPSSVMRELGLLPAATQSEPAPEIGFNSAYEWDFDPTDDVDVFLTDFASTATHELGHALGFTSQVGATELDPGSPPSASVWDFNRFRPGSVAFGSTERILTAGGEQVYESQGSYAPLSTGRSDHSGGDRQQASHWKADEISGFYVGIMDPTLAPGQHENITGWDLYALNRMGYQIALPNREAEISNLDPTTVRPGASGTTLYVLGNDIAAGAVVLWRGQPRVATVYSSNAVSIELSAADLQSFGEASIEVQNPGAIVSNTLYFQIGCFRCTRVVSRPGRPR